MPIGPARMPIMDHLGELRRRLTIIVVAVVVCALVVYFATPALIELMIDQIRDAMNGAELVVTTVLGGFSIRFKVALFFSVIICCPIIIWEVMAFFLPALKPKERRWVVPTVGAMVALFFLGMIFCFFIIPAGGLWLAARAVARDRQPPARGPATTWTSTCCWRSALASRSSCRSSFSTCPSCTSCRTRRSARSGASSTLPSWCSPPW